jgi:hypothetical protein
MTLHPSAKMRELNRKHISLNIIASGVTHRGRPQA